MISVAIMAHPNRAGMVEALVTKLDYPHTIVWDRKQNRRDTGWRSWEAHDPDADYHVVIQDDAVVPANLIPALERAHAMIPDTSPLVSYLGRVRPYAQRVRDLGPCSFVVANKILWGVTISMPTRLIEPALRQPIRRDEQRYDAALSRYFEARGRDCYYPLPSLVDHLDTPSLVGHGDGRSAYKWIGPDAGRARFDGGVARMSTGPVRRNSRRYAHQSARRR